ncbi:MAG: glycoside hydrolase family 3 C-terminal domain-containing protein [Clostridia bacterium]|nr:glycoside hydrolase family 3 C-terminal domain-containing protein [Clostridia bacterium]
MKKGMSIKKSIAIFTPCITAVVAIMIVIAIMVSMFVEDISLWLYGRAQNTDAAVLADGRALCEDIVEEGIVLLKNEEDKDGTPALPLSKSELEKGVNVFGWAGYDWMTMAFGSGYSNTDQPREKLFPALEKAGIAYNEDLYNLYKDYYTAHNKTYGDGDYLEYRGGVAFGSEEIFVLREPSYNDYINTAVKSPVIDSGVGLVVIGRTGSESKDLSATQQVRQTKSGSNTTQTFGDKHYLQLSPDEENMIKAATELCDKVIVVLNTANTMETGFIENEDIQGALLVGITGLSGVNGLINVLKGEKDAPVVVTDGEGNPVYYTEADVEALVGTPTGEKTESGEDILYTAEEAQKLLGTPKYEKNADGTIKTEPKKVSPSGRTADTFAYDILGTTPATVNLSATKYSSGAGNNAFDHYVDYSEGIYVGYKWFETADAEHYWDEVDNEYGKGYEGVVQYPFGYGLSYASFVWEVEKVSIPSDSELKKNSKIEITVKVTNTSTEYPGADVVELYYNPPYIKGGIEKASRNLADFAKTNVIQPGGYDIVTLTVTAQGMASYDCYDKNGNGHTGYELDGGTYEVLLMKNSHEQGDMATGSSAVLTYTVPEGGYNFDTDEANPDATVENRFTNKDGKGNDQTIDEADLDGSHENGGGVKYMSRDNFKETYPKAASARAMNATALSVAQTERPSEAQLAYAGYTDDDLGTKRDRTGSGNGLTLADALGTEDYDDGIWSDLIVNITDDELRTLVKDGYFKTAKIDSIGKGAYIDLDGPLGFNTRVTGGNGTTCEFMAYPSGTMLAQTWNTDLATAMGRSVGRERNSMEALRGWYAPGANTHRHPFGGRNGEYYSEDGVLAGKICAGTVSGAKDMGVYSYVKHFAVNDTELEREGLFTFLTEQTLREIYLKPFEIMIKEGGGNALMTSMNRLGRVWSGANYGLMTEIVRDEWGFRGTAVTDWINSDSDRYAPTYRGIWAGNDIWLSNGLNYNSSLTSFHNDTGLKIAEKVAHNVLWTYVDTVNAETAYDPSVVTDTGETAQYNLVWIAGVVVLEVVMLAGVGVMAFFLVRNILKGRKAGAAEETAESSEAESNDTAENES